MVEPDVKYEVVKAMEYWASGFCICRAVKVPKGQEEEMAENIRMDSHKLIYHPEGM